MTDAIAVLAVLGVLKWSVVLGAAQLARRQKRRRQPHDSAAGEHDEDSRPLISSNIDFDGDEDDDENRQTM